MVGVSAAGGARAGRQGIGVVNRNLERVGARRRWAGERGARAGSEGSAAFRPGDDRVSRDDRRAVRVAGSRCRRGQGNALTNRNLSRIGHVLGDAGARVGVACAANAHSGQALDAADSALVYEATITVIAHDAGLSLAREGLGAARRCNVCHGALARPARAVRSRQR